MPDREGQARFDAEVDIRVSIREIVYLFPLRSKGPQEKVSGVNCDSR